MSFFINVPQQKICRWSKQKSSAKLQGFYTGDFSSCNIIIILNLNTSQEDPRVSMIHADRSIDAALVNQELDWVGKNSILYVLRHDTLAARRWLERNASDLNKQPILHILSGRINISLTFTNLPTTKNFREIANFCQFHESNAIPTLQILRHPQEKDLLVTEKINWMFALVDDPYVIAQNPLLFDGEYWQPLLTEEVTLSAKANKHIVALGKGKGFLAIYRWYQEYLSKNLRGKASEEDIHQIVEAAAPYVLFYTYQFDAKTILLTNLEETIFHSFIKPTNTAEQEFMQSLLHIISSPTIAIQKILSELKALVKARQAEQHLYIRSVSHFLNLYMQHYDHADFYIKNEAYLNVTKNLYATYVADGTKAFSAKKFDVAQPAFEKALELVQKTECYPSILLGKALYNLGATYHELHKINLQDSAYATQANDFLKRTNSWCVVTKNEALKTKATNRLQELQDSRNFSLSPLPYQPPTGIKHLIPITQYGVGRIQRQSDALVAGLYTNKLTSCLAIIVVSSTQLYLAHLDTNLDVSAVVDVLQDVVGTYHLTVVYNSFMHEMHELLNNPKGLFSKEQFIIRLRAKLPVKNIPVWATLTYKKSDQVAVLVSGEVTTKNLDQFNYAQLENSGIRESINFLHYMLSDQPTDDPYAFLPLDWQFKDFGDTSLPSINFALKTVIYHYKLAEKNLVKFYKNLTQDKTIKARITDTSLLPATVLVEKIEQVFSFSQKAETEIIALNSQLIQHYKCKEFDQAETIKARIFQHLPYATDFIILAKSFYNTGTVALEQCHIAEAREYLSCSKIYYTHLRQPEFVEKVNNKLRLCDAANQQPNQAQAADVDFAPQFKTLSNSLSFK